jgi:hypothetical protein
VQRKNITASDYAHLPDDGNGRSLHYSHFQALLKITRLQINHLRNEKILRRAESAKAG